MRLRYSTVTVGIVWKGKISTLAGNRTLVVKAIVSSLIEPFLSGD
jgi:hypothetical protein